MRYRKRGENYVNAYKVRRLERERERERERAREKERERATPNVPKKIQISVVN